MFNVKVYNIYILFISQIYLFICVLNKPDFHPFFANIYYILIAIIFPVILHPTIILLYSLYVLHIMCGLKYRILRALVEI